VNYILILWVAALIWDIFTFIFTANYIYFCKYLHNSHLLSLILHKIYIIFTKYFPVNALF